MTVVLRHEVDDPDDREHGRHPALTARIEVAQRSSIAQDEDGEREENDVLQEALQMGQLDRITEATAVGDGVSDERVERHGRHHQHEEHGETRAELAVHSHKQESPEQELGATQHEGHRQRERLGTRCCRAEDGGEILRDLQRGTHGIDGLQKARGHEDEPYDDAGYFGEGMTHMDHAAGRVSLMRQKMA